MNKQRLRITLNVLNKVKDQFLETKEFIDDCIEQECSKENISVEEVIFLLTCVEAKGLHRKTFIILQC